MKILVHGRQHGYNVLYPKPTPDEFYYYANDVQSESANDDYVNYGKCFYTLAFEKEGCIFTKYVIGYDKDRTHIGEIGICIFIPNSKKLSGQDIKLLLDELITTYRSNYMLDNNIVEPKNGYDWQLFTELANSYDIKLLAHFSNNDNVTKGEQKPAFHYYKSDNELIEHFDKPFQEEYRDYKQILFIDFNFQGNTNPLNILKNSGVEVNPDLNNEYYYLNNFNSNIKVNANGKSRSDKRGENQIRSKWQIEIKYSKDYHKPIVAIGSISNPASDIHKYLEINGSNIRIKYDAFLPNPETKTITFDVIRKKDGVKVTGAEISVDNQPWQSDLKITFSGEDIGREHKILARINDKFYGERKITPRDYKEAPLPLELIEKKVLNIIVKEAEGERNYIGNFKVWVSNGKCNSQTDHIVFTDKEIGETYKITVEKEGFLRSEAKSYSPRNGSSTIDFELKKDNKQHSRDNKSPNYPSTLQNNGNPKSFAEKLITFLAKPAGIATLIVSALVFGFVILALYHFSGNDKQQKKDTLNNFIIKMYVEGDSLMLDKLNAYKTIWENQEQDFITKSGGGMFGGDEIVDSKKWKNVWKPADESIDRAIKKRKLINNQNIAELRDQHYSDGQLSFRAAIEKIDSTKYTEVGTLLGNVSTLTLSQIAKEIDSILKSMEPVKEEAPQEPIMEEKKPKRKKETSEKNELPKKQTNPAEQMPSATDKTSEIIQYIKGSELDEAKLIAYKTNGINQKLKNSIQLCLDFWALDGSGSGNKSKTYSNFQNKVNADNNFSNSKLKEFLNKMSQEGENPSYSKQDKRKGLK